PPCSPLFPYTTLFRSLSRGGAQDSAAVVGRTPAQSPPPHPKPEPRLRSQSHSPQTLEEGWLRKGFLLRYVYEKQMDSDHGGPGEDRKSTRLNSSHVSI